MLNVSATSAEAAEPSRGSGEGLPPAPPTPPRPPDASGLYDIRRMFREVADRCAESPAIRSGDLRMTYEELDSASDQLAAVLRERGTGPGDAVVILAEKAVDVISGMLAALKVGALFVPLDPRTPRRRLEAMIDVASPAVFLAGEGAGAELAAARNGGSPVLGIAAGRLAHGAGASPLDRGFELEDMGPEDPCYLYFTSGSTGQPKAITGRLKSIAHFIRWEIEALGVEEGWRVSQLINPSFDAFLRDVFVPLCSGGTICVPPDRETVADARRLVAWLAEERIQLVHCVPSLFRTLLQVEPLPLPDLRWALLSGEPLLPADVKRWIGLYGDSIRLVNLYGPSETTMTKFVYFVEAADAERRTIPIGKPMPGARAVVLDPRGKVCPPRAVGEIYIRTPYRSLGYHGRPDLTAEVFVRNPFSQDPEDLIYKTGDLGRVLDDGNFEFLGRKDSQVKVRGVRIELAEIESLLLSSPRVRETAVVDLEDADGTKLLCAYVVLNDQAGTAGLREHLAVYLPEHSLPSLFVALAELPRTLSGKVDRRALPPPEQRREGSGGALDLPRSPVEEIVADLFAQVLGLGRLGIHESFFELGGHSLIATQVLTRIRSTFDVEIPLRSLFSHPTVAGLARQVEEGLRGEGGEAPPLVTMARSEPPPLSFAQERLWFLDSLRPGSAIYNIPLAVRFRGPLRVEVLARALGEVERRHEALRTSFATFDGRPVQVLSPVPRIALRRVDLRGFPAECREAEASARAADEARRPFDLASGPLVRISLLQLGPEEQVGLLVLHHSIADAWSLSVLMREISIGYEAFAGGRPFPLPAPPIQYADYAVWQRQWMTGAVLARHLSYWRDELSGAPENLDMPLDHPRPAVPSQRGGLHWMRVADDLAAQMRSFAARHDSSLFMVLLSAFQTLLHRYSGQTRIDVGSPIANRHRAEIEGLIGFFVNTLVLRGDLTGDPTGAELLARVRETALGAYTHQDIPFEKLVEELQPERDLARNPLFQTVLALQNVPSIALRLPDLTLEMVPVDTGTAKFDFSLTLAEEEHLMALCEYATDLFEAVTVARLLEHFRNLLAGLVGDPARRLSDLPLLGASDRQQLLLEWNDTEVPHGPEPLVHEMFSWHARRQPEAVAVDGVGGRLTYGELESRSNRLAHRLRARGVGPEVLVALCTERTPERVVGIVAVLKAGGAYVSLDPTYPRERLSFLLADAQAPVLLTQRQFLPVLPESAASVILLDGESGESADADLPAPSSGVGPANLAYVVYTSGSTGRPKGVEIPHVGLRNLVRWHQSLYGVVPEDRGTQIASPAFDASIWELWPYLAGGASVHIPDEETRLSSSGMLRWWHEQGITLAYLMTPLAEGVLEEPVRRDLALRVRALIIGGDRLHRGPDPALGLRLMNHYGPAEYTVTSTVVEVPAQGAGSGIPTIGRPVDNTQIYLLDRELSAVPIGVPGELFVAGTGIARGYLRRADLTAEKFVPNPFSAEPGSRMYRTADLVRYLPDGDMDFLGRLDHQVKIRGFRVELREIESALAEHPGVGQAAVVVQDDPARGRSLLAYVVPEGGTVPGQVELRDFLRDTLPDYMVPARFMILASLPQSANGKVDRRALSDLYRESARAEGSRHVAPRSPSEELMAGIFAEVLQAGEISVEESFFDLGGHSLLATQLVSRVRRTFGVDLPIRAVFEAPTVAGLAANVERLRQAGEGISLPPIERVSRDRALPLSFAQQRLWFLDQLSSGGNAYNVPSAVRLVGSLDIPAFAASLYEVVRRHETLRTTFGKEAGEPVQRIALSGPLPLPVVDLRGLPAPAREPEALSLARAEAERAFDLAQGPLLRAQLLLLSGEENVIALTMHHIVSDDWSMGVLVQELVSLYEASSQGRPSPLPELPLQYADFACWQRQWLAGEVLNAEIAHWRERLAGAAPHLDLPTDRPRPAVQTFAGASCAVALPEPLSAELKAMARGAGATLFMALLATFQALLCRYSGQTDLSVGTPSAGRNHFQTEGLIGFFVNTLVLRTELSSAQTFQGLLATARETALDAYLHQDLPFEKLVEQLQPERSLGHSPLFQVMLVLQNAPRAALTLPGLRFEPFTVPRATAKFDLTLTLVETPGGLAGSLDYNRDLFAETTVRRLARSWTRLVEAAVTEPAGRVLELTLLAPAERHQLIVEWNDTAGSSLREAGVHRWIEAQAAERPDAVALTFETQALTYADLNARANRLARRLRALGVGPERAVGVSVERSLELIVGLLAILKAGGVYVPLEPSLPAERLTFLVEDVAGSLGMPALLTQRRHAERAARGIGSDRRLIVLDADPLWAAIGGEGNLEDGPAADHLAYVIYTSGSTGTPKGAMNTHGAICNRLLWQRRAHGLTEMDRFAQKTPLSFDVSMWELLLPLMVGARLAVARPEGHRDRSYLIDLIATREITVLHFVPSMLEVFLEGPDLSGCRSLRQVVASGEALSSSLEQRLFSRLGAELRNLYGPTEAAVDVTDDLCLPGATDRFVSIGRPIDNVLIRLLEAHLGPAPLGAVGELYIGGVAPARGYLRRPALTAEKFVPDPFGASPGARLYRTGDLARYLPEGRIQYLGRTDHQVKIRGFRIELGEVEAALAGHPQVRQAVVLDCEGPQGDRRLAAWIVTGEEPPSPDDLRQRLRSHLPEYMVPADFTFLDSLPLTLSGKVDRRALPAPGPNVRAGRAPAAAPRDEVEHRLLEIWEEVLGVSGLGIADSFFESGGHSLSAVRLVARIEAQLGQALPLSAVFQAATVERMASLLRAGAPAVPSTRPIVVKLQGGSRRPFFCIHPIGGNVFCYVPLARALGREQPFYGLQMPDFPSPVAERLGTLEGMASCYVEAMREVQPTGPYRLGGWSMGAVVAFEMARQLRQAGEDLELVAMLDAPAPGDHRRAGELDRSSILADFARDLTGALPPVPVEELRQLDIEQQLGYVLEWAKEAGALPASETLDRLAGLFAAFEHNFLVLGRHEPSPYPGPLELFRANDTVALRPDSGWASLAHGGVTLHEIPGDHFSIMRSPELLGERLGSLLERTGDE
jgi:amino acid adenylation domain-containing protein